MLNCVQYACYHRVHILYLFPSLEKTTANFPVKFIFVGENSDFLNLVQVWLSIILMAFFIAVSA